MQPTTPSWPSVPSFWAASRQARHPRQQAGRSSLCCPGPYLALLAVVVIGAGLDAAARRPLLASREPHQPPLSPVSFGSGRFWHLTDIHLGASPSLACHSFNDSNTAVGPETAAGKFGSPLTFCDSPPALLNLTLASTRRITDGHVDFIVITGDLARHDSNLFKSYEDNLDLIRTVTEAVHQTWSSVPLLLSLGNNDVYPHNSLAPHSRFLSSMAKVWSRHIPLDQLPTFGSYGWFARPLAHGLIGVSLNTIAFFASNPNATDCLLDVHGYGARHLHWLEHHVLKRAKRLGQSVLISGHIPPEPNAWLAGCLGEYARLASRFEGTIMGHLFGHVNLDHFVFLNSFPPPPPPPSSHRGRQPMFSSVTTQLNQQQPMLPIILDENPLHASLMQEQVTALLHNQILLDRLASSGNLSFPVALVSPSVIPNYLPSIRLFEYSSSQHTLLDYHQYLLNLTVSAAAGPEPPEYTLEYSARDAYGLSDLTSQSYWQLALALIVPNPDERAQRLKNTFWRYFAVSTGVE